MREIGRALGAGYVVEGSVRRAGDRVRITAQLVDAATGAHLWAERWDRPLEDVFAVQDEIARGIVATVAARVLEESEAAARRRPPRDVRAYDLFLQGYRLSDMHHARGAGAGPGAVRAGARARPDLRPRLHGARVQPLMRASDVGIGVPARGRPRPGRGAAPGRAGARARPERPAGALRAGLHVPDVARLRPRRAPPRLGAGHEPERRADPDRLGVGAGLPGRGGAGAAGGRAGDAAQPAPPALLRALPVARPVPRPAPRRGGGAPRSGSRPSRPSSTRATWRGRRRPAATWGRRRRRGGAAGCSSRRCGGRGAATRRRARRSTWTGWSTPPTCGAPRTRRTCGKACGWPACRPDLWWEQRGTARRPAQDLHHRSRRQIGPPPL